MTREPAVTREPARTRLRTFNQLPDEDARRVLLEVCPAPRWAEKLAAGRPYTSPEGLYRAADDLTDADVTAALAGHPRIGERPAAGSASAAEQRDVAGAGTDVRAALAEGNRRYEERFGHVYLVAAAGRGADELLADLRGRMYNEPAAEWAVLRGELARINRNRLAGLVEERP